VSLTKGTFGLHPLGTGFNLARIAAAGQNVWFESQFLPNAAGVYDPVSKTSKLIPLPHTPSGRILVTKTQLWISLLGLTPAVYHRSLGVPSGAFDFVKGEQFPLTWEVGDIVAPPDGSIWAAVSHNPLGGVTSSGPPVSGAADSAELVRVRPPVVTRGGHQLSTIAKVGVGLPAGWQPRFLVRFAAQPQLVYVIARTGEATAAVARVKLGIGGPVTKLFDLPALPWAACAASDGTLWVCCNVSHTKQALEGWLVHCDTTAASPTPQTFHDPARGLLGIAEGVDGRMFLLRRFADPTFVKASQDIFLFKGSPMGGAYGSVGTLAHPKLADSIVAASDGSFWISYSEPATDTVLAHGLARFVPPDVDPLDPDS